MVGIYGNHPEDRYFERMLDKHLNAIDKRDEELEAKADELRDEYLEEDDQIFDVLISEEWSGDVSSVVRAMVNAHLLGNHASWECFAKSLTQSIIEGVDKKAKFYAERT